LSVVRPFIRPFRTPLSISVPYPPFNFRSNRQISKILFLYERYNIRYISLYFLSVCPYPIKKILLGQHWETAVFQQSNCCFGAGKKCTLKSRKCPREKQLFQQCWPAAIHHFFPVGCIFSSTEPAVTQQLLLFSSGNLAAGQQQVRFSNTFPDAPQQDAAV
jgi:hypothetical protein